MKKFLWGTRYFIKEIKIKIKRVHLKSVLFFIDFYLIVIIIVYKEYFLIKVYMEEITYWELIRYVRPFFLSRGWDVLANIDNLMFYANAAIQDVYNSDNSTFIHITEELTWVIDWDYMKFTSTYPIRKIQDMEDQDQNKINTTLFRITEYDAKFEWKQILAHKNRTKLSVCYLRDYEWATYPADLNKWIWLPKRYIPAVIKLLYDWAAPINLMAGETATTDFFSHWMNRINKLAENDSLTDHPGLHSAY